VFWSYVHIAYCAVTFKDVTLTSFQVSTWHFTLQPVWTLFALKASAVMEVNQVATWSITFYEYLFNAVLLFISWPLIGSKLNMLCVVIETVLEIMTDDGFHHRVRKF
jgi:hypothetical protein